MKLRVTNSCAKYVVKSWLPFKELTPIAPDLVRVSIAIEASNFLTVQRLLAATYNDRCELCEELESFVQLLKCMRCCFHCLSSDRRLYCIIPGFSTLSSPNTVVADSTVTVMGMKLQRKYVERVPKVHTILQESLWGER